MFITPVLMPCTDKQYRLIKDDLEALGYEMQDIEFDLIKYPYLSTYYDGQRNGYGSLDKEFSHIEREEIEYNPDLFLALAAMTDKRDGIAGEYWYCIRSMGIRSMGELSFTENKLYKAIKSLEGSHALISNDGTANGNSGSNHKYFRKATKEEIISHFKQIVMTQKITRGQLIDLYNGDSCSKWKQTIEKYLDSCSKEKDSYKLEVNSSDITLLTKEGTEKQIQLVESAGIVVKADNILLLENIEKTSFKDMMYKITGVRDAIQLLDACTPDDKPELRGRAFYIHSSVRVETVKVEQGTYIAFYKK